ncbi:MAG: protein BatD, partial [Pseudomonadota bacterium]|nr:protein BatD [Pseudomonadota bacterium]
VAPRDAVGRGWALAALGFAALWLLTLLWALQRRMPAAQEDGAGNRVVRDDAARPPPASGALKQALATGDLGEVADVLCALAHPPAGDVDALLQRLDDDAQRAALLALQRARWGDGDGVAARVQLRSAFARGPRWHRKPVTSAPPLPPLYPRG